MDALTTLLLGGIISALTQIMKELFPSVQPLLWVGLLAVIGGFVYGFLIPILPTEIVEKSLYSFSIAVGLYETLKAFIPSK